jgi:hypothetical protein
MGSNHTLQNESNFDKGRLIYGSDDTHDERKPVSQDFSKNLKATVNKADRLNFFILLASGSLGIRVKIAKLSLNISCFPS